VLEVATVCIFIGVRIMKEMPGSVASGTHGIKISYDVKINNKMWYYTDIWNRGIRNKMTFMTKIRGRSSS
jgi:hypothetical protein